MPSAYSLTTAITGPEGETATSFKIGTIAACFNPLSAFLYHRKLGRIDETDRLREQPHENQPFAAVTALVQRAMSVLTDLLEQLVPRLFDPLLRGRWQGRRLRGIAGRGPRQRLG